MKLLLDSADAGEVRAAVELGWIDGVTTNPALLVRAGTTPRELVAAVADLVSGPVSVPVRATEADAIVREGRELAQLHENVVVKIPIQVAGLRAMAKLHSEGVRTHATLCCSATQALLVARAGADFLSPPVGRLAEQGGAAPFELLGQIIEIYDNYEFDTQIVVASVRSAADVLEAARLGADACTVPWRILDELLRHPLTERLRAEFLADWKRL
jgi:transaldolase